MQELFLENSTKRPVIVLSGVKLADLRSIMQFIYTGEVSVSEEDLPDLLEVAEMLGVRGLKSGQENSKRKEDVEESDEIYDAPETSNDVSEGSKTEEVPASLSVTKLSPENHQAESSDQASPSKAPSEGFQISVKKDLTSEITSEETDTVTDDNVHVDDSSSSFPSPLLPPVTSQYSPYFPPAAYSLANPLVSMTNLAAMYQQSSPSKLVSKERTVTTGQQRALEWYKQASEEGKVALDLLPEDINSIMSQSITPFCPICNKDCANFPNLRSHLQVSPVDLILSIKR